MKELTEFQAVVQCKCPRCRKGDIFPGKMYGFQIQRTNEHCTFCDLRFEREPGYFYVAMFVSYAMNVIEIITIGVGAYTFGLKLEYENLWYFVGLIMAGILLLSPFNYRYSRVILLHWLTPGLKYIPDLMNKKKQLKEE
ncbi:MAG: DUF983 domain-containing protein [Pedobacter sp.]|nr:MAG: DUF983 domain-containing protein [Pedobacter sp.]